MKHVYKYNLISHVEHPDYIVVKTANGRYYELPKTFFTKLKSLVKENGLINVENLTPAALKNLIQKNIITDFVDDEISRNTNFHWRKAIIKGSELASLCKVLAPMISLWFLAIFVAAIATIITLFPSELSSIYNQENFNKAIYNISFTDMYILIALIFASGIIHEMGHAVAHQKYTGTSYEIGLCINYIIPSFYADVSDTVMLNEKFKKVIIGMSGMYFQLLTYPIVVLLFFYLGDLKIPIFISIIVALQLLFNIFPAMRNDGYYIYRDLLGIKKFAGESTVNKSKLPLKEKLLYLLAIPGFIYMAFITINGIKSLATIYQSQILGYATVQPFDYVRAVLALVYLIFATKILFQIFKHKQ